MTAPTPETTALAMAWLERGAAFLAAASLLWFTHLPALVRLAGAAPAAACVLALAYIARPDLVPDLARHVVDLAAPLLHQLRWWAPVFALALRGLLGGRRAAPPPSRGGGDYPAEAADPYDGPSVRDVGVVMHRVTGHTVNVTAHHHHAARRTIEGDQGALRGM